jgi:HTH-type transcriptional regulator / antitoxin HigA
MRRKALNEFDPDYAVPPGEVLAETLESRSIPHREFAALCGISDDALDRLIAGEAPVTDALAARFETVLGVSAAVWRNLESMYRSHKDGASRQQAAEALG